MRLKSIALIIILACSASITAQEKSLFHRAKIYYSTPNDIQLLSSMGLEMDHGAHKKGVFIESDYSAKELNLAEEAGFQTEIVIHDVQSYYVEQNKNAVANNFQKNFDCVGDDATSYETPENFELGSMGGFFTYEEILAELDEMAALYPNLISAKTPIGDFETYEGRDIFWMRMSNNPNVNQDKPEMLYDAVHHAREPASVATLIYYMWYLLENYDSDVEVQAILDNSELYFVPVLNPDGYVHNVTTNPNGGGMWRKNRRPHDDGEFGVDNNRNYGYNWGTSGISFNTESDVYCGSEAFSEAENQAMKWFCENHEFLIAFNNHSYSNLLLYPFGYDEDVVTDENDIFMAISEEMVSENGFINQTGANLYPASGVSDDWMYIETPEKARIFSFTPEIGSTAQGFWPTSPEIIPLANSVMYMNLTAAHMITKYSAIEDQMGSILNDPTGSINFDLKRLGLQPADFTVELIPVSSNITFTADAVVFSGLELLQSSSATMPYALDPNIANGDDVIYKYQIDNGDYLQFSKTYILTYGAQTPVFSDDASDLTEWGSSDWDITTEDFVSSPSSITDSPNQDYDDNSNIYIILDEEVSLVDVVTASLNFEAKWEIEEGWDYVQVEVSTNGVEWTPQCGLHTTIGNSNQAENEPLYDGDSNGWVSETINLSDYIGENITIRFQLRSDGFVTEDGFYFDDINVSVAGGAVGVEEISLNDSFLRQNSPNPTSGLTSISYNFPDKNDNGRMVVQNYLGQDVLTIPLNQSEGNVDLDLTRFSAGAYFYSIHNDVQEIARKKLVIVK